MSGWVAGAIVVGGVASAAISSSAAKSAASTQANAANRAADLTQQQYQNMVKQEQPFMNAGYGSLQKLNNLLGVGPATRDGGYGSLLAPFTIDKFHQMSPAYQFALQQGEQGTLNGASASGSVLGGAAQKELMRYNQNYANTAFNDAFNQYQTQQGNIYSRLANIANLGQNAAANTGQTGANLASSTAQSITNAGSAQAAGQIGAANAWSGALSSLPWALQAGTKGTTLSTIPSSTLNSAAYNNSLTQAETAFPG
jgi:hypothetical protein